MTDRLEQVEEPTFGVVPGLEYQRAIIDGVIPTPRFTALLGMRVRSVTDDGATICDVTPRQEFANSADRLHGGYLSALMDCATATAVHSQQPAGTGAPHIHASYRFLASAGYVSALVVTARPTHVGKSVTHAAAEVRTANGRLLAMGETIHKIRSVRPTRHSDGEAGAGGRESAG